MKIYNVNINGFWFNTNELFLAEDETEAETAAYHSHPEAVKLKVKAKIFKDDIVVEDLIIHAQDLKTKQIELVPLSTNKQSLQIDSLFPVFLDAFNEKFLRAKILHMGLRQEGCYWFTIDF